MTNCVTKPVLIIAGPTAIGKTALSLRIAEQYGCEVVSVDSMQVYRYMDIGTAKVTPDEMGDIPHHLIDIVDPDEDYDAARFADDALVKIVDIHARKKIPLLTGGTGLYLRALFDGIFADVPSDAQIREQLRERLNKEGRDSLYAELQRVDAISAERIHANDTQRLLRALEIYLATGKTWTEHMALQQKSTNPAVFENVLKIGLTTERKRLYSRINMRSMLMFDLGLIDEVEQLLLRGFEATLKSMNSIGYRHAVNVITGEWSRKRALELLARDTRRYAKRQYTWFNADPDMRWFDIDNPEDILREVHSWTSRCNDI